MHWTLCALIIGSFGCKYIHAQAQRIAPGIPPQHYQQPIQVPPQHAHPVPQQHQYQQVPVQQVPVQQQVPIQQVPQMPMQQQATMQVPVQQVPVQQQPQVQQQPGVQQGHGHGHGHGQQPQILNAANIAHEKEHIAEHADVPIDTSKMSDQELQFHYFKMHDADNNNKLDGCELIKSLIHWHEQGNSETGEAQDKLFKDEELIQLIDPILSMDDTNNDGYIDYPEFIQAQQNAAANSRT